MANTWELDFSKPEKMVMIGNRLYEDVIFGNHVGMNTIYVTDLNRGAKLKFENVGML